MGIFGDGDLAIFYIIPKNPQKSPRFLPPHDLTLVTGIIVVEALARARIYTHILLFYGLN